MLQILCVALVCAEYLKDVYCSPLREAKRALKDDWLIKAVHYMEENPETLEELMDKNYALAEGDMVLLNDRNAVSSSWPTLEIPYIISPDLASRTDDILSAMEMVSKHTCVSFHKRTIEQNYLLFKTSTGCASFVGLKGGEQPVFVGAQCIVGNIAHEILHALGFHHEHTRMDREQYITIIHSNIMPGMEKNFRMQDGETFSLPYDVTSIMHYGRDFFSATGLPTIFPKKDVKEMGQRDKMTKTDIERVRRLYSCEVIACGILARCTEELFGANVEKLIHKMSGTQKAVSQATYQSSHASEFKSYPNSNSLKQSEKESHVTGMIV